MAFDNEFQDSSTPQGTLQEKILANILVARKLSLIILAMTIGIVAVFFIALQGIDNIENQQQIDFDFISAPLIALNDADIALGELQTELILLENPALSPEEKAAHLEKIANAEKVVASTLQKYEAEWLVPGELTFTSRIYQTRKEEIQQSLDALSENEASLFGQIKDMYGAYNVESDLLYRNIKYGSYDDRMEDRINNSINSIHAPLRQLMSVHTERLQLADEISQSNYQDTIARMFLALVLAIGFGLLFSNSIARSIGSRLNTLRYEALALQDDLLDRRAVVAIVGRDEIALVSRSLDIMYRRLIEIFSDLERKVKERTASLVAATAESNKRAKQFEAITKVARAISTTQNLEELLPRISRVISEQFGYYHVGIFLIDSVNQYAVLGAANSEGGRRMLARGHRLKIGEQGIVGYATGTSRPRIALSVGEDAVYFNNPDLPLTQSEMALPLISGDQVIGALDIQSTETNAFTPEDIEVLSPLADHVSLAIQNARLFDQTAKLLSESDAIQRQYLRDTWSRLPQEQQLTGYKYSITGTTPLKEHEDSKRFPGDKREISVPINLRGESIGTLMVQVPQDEKISPDQIDLIKAVAERVALSAENARLFDETQKRAAQLESLNEMGRVVSQQIELKAVLMAAYEQLKRVIPMDAYVVALYDEVKQTVHLPLVIDEGKEFTDDIESPLNPNSSTGKVLVSGKPILQLLTESEYLSGIEQTNMLGNSSKISASLMYLPLLIAQKTIGVLSIQSYTLNAYTQDQVTLVENIANQLSIAIQNARLFEEANRRAERERIISEITSKIGSSVRTENILKTTAKELNQFFDGAEVLIRLTVDEPQKENQ